MTQAQFFQAVAESSQLSKAQVRALFDGVNDLSSGLGLREHFYMDGGYICMNYLTKDQEGKASLAFRTLFSQELIKHKVLMPWVSVSLAHQDKELKHTLSAVEKSLQVYKKALRHGIEKYLSGPAIKPVFRKFN